MGKPRALPDLIVLRLAVFVTGVAKKDVRWRSWRDLEEETGGLGRIDQGEHENRAETRSERGREKGPVWPVTPCILYVLHTRARGS